jgi:hypothetical protein
MRRWSSCPQFPAAFSRGAERETDSACVHLSLRCVYRPHLVSLSSALLALASRAIAGRRNRPTSFAHHPALNMVDMREANEGICNLCVGDDRACARSTPCTALRSATVSRGWAPYSRHPAAAVSYESSASRGLSGYTTHQFITAIGIDSP